MTIRASSSQALLVEQMLGSTLGAIVRAQGLAASQLAELIEQVGFERAEDGTLEARTFSFRFQRSELAEGSDTLVERTVTATLPLLSVVNLPAIGIDEAQLDLRLRLVAHDEAAPVASKLRAVSLPSALKLFAIPAKTQIVRGSATSTSVDPSGTLAIRVTLRRQESLGQDRLQDLLDGAFGEQAAAGTE
ncbi:MAG TPA: DUF2589 domain-containing protein [Pseudomonadales bacterium]|nr:DUF2589 domain-containing protein [Pseudomonadales bacterium]